MALGNLGIEALAKAVGCSKLEAVNVIIRCNAEAAPYLHPRLASLELKARGEVGGRSSTLALDHEILDITPDDTTP